MELPVQPSCSRKDRKEEMQEKGDQQEEEEESVQLATV